ncbi:putative beta-lysine N-acetyltransferase [Bacillus atrophaeus]|uniref:putative beta-lysine N-acetyltransferase n=1 Tax=Bacillus atrophaeus TaxID=1452 RepID=UPI001BA9FAA4|nr:putative beta-lysine N-acetyltransferase [Bacillus atrophaeus]QUF63670.1 putative beta-lysine N-acetyltransferase [Bacillus atrophaeus]
MIRVIKREGVSAYVDIDRFNERIRVVRYDGKIENALPEILSVAKKELAEKVIVYAKQQDEAELAKHLFVTEGLLDGYYLGHRAAVMVRYLSENRRLTNSYLAELEIVETLYKKSPSIRLTAPPPFLMSRCEPRDIHQLSMLYKKVFRTYPTPIFDPVYIEKTMNDNTVYYAMFDDGRLIGAASAEANPALGHAEITDCAVLKEYRGHSLMNHLIAALEKEMADREIFHVFSLARAASYGMNAVLHQSGYSYRGRLINNCYIYESLENMNVWCKTL